MKYINIVKCNCYFDYICEDCQEKLTLTNKYLINNLSKIIINYQKQFQFNKKYECDCSYGDCYDCQYYLRKLQSYLSYDISSIIIRYINYKIPLHFWFNQTTQLAVPQLAFIIL